MINIEGVNWYGNIGCYSGDPQVTFAEVSITERGEQRYDAWADVQFADGSRRNGWTEGSKTVEDARRAGSFILLKVIEEGKPIPRSIAA